MVEVINRGLARTMLAIGELRQRLSEERGQGLLEYAVLSGVIAVFVGGLGAALIATGAAQSMACGIGDFINLSDTPLVGCP